jgi:hypothetical protein
MFDPEAEGGVRTQTFDLRRLSEANLRRHRPWRVLSGVIALAIASGVAWASIVYLTSSAGRSFGPSAYFIVACGCVTAFCCVAMSLAPFRFLAPAPVSLSVKRDGLGFGFAHGEHRSMAWSTGFQQVVLYLRPDTPELPKEVQFRLDVLGKPYDTILPWRRVIPFTYLPAGAADVIVSSAQLAGMTIVRKENSRPISLPPSKPGSVILISRPSP